MAKTFRRTTFFAMRCTETHTGGTIVGWEMYSIAGSLTLFLVFATLPFETSEEDVAVVTERNYLFAGVKDQQPIVKTSDAEEPVPAHSSLTWSAEEQPGYHRRATPAVSGHVSAVIQLRALSSFSSLEPLHSPSGRLLTLHLEKDQAELFPSAPIRMLYDPDLEVKYNTDPTSLVLFAIERLDIRKDREEAFECFVHVKEAEENTRGTLSYYVQCIGGAAGLGQLYLEAGLLHLEGAASVVLSASYATLSSVRVPAQPQPENGAEAWQRDRDAASRYFDRVRADKPDRCMNSKRLRWISRTTTASASAYSGEGSMYSEQKRVARRRRQERAKDELIFIDDVKGKDNMDNAWYLYVPSLVGAGTALLVVGAIGALSLSPWRRNQGVLILFLTGIVRACSDIYY
ncbi:hypothetical protein EDC04DRAFT_2607659 [Pisolithus marmoratus]|nr:hypothetical protein EDC04DRAFT_2607659 [Pisolithus marmoratus]